MPLLLFRVERANNARPPSEAVWRQWKPKANSELALIRRFNLWRRR